MPISVKQAINSETGEKIQIRRMTGGDFVDGIWNPGQLTIIKAFASVQQPDPEEIQLITGLERDKDVKIFYTNKAVQASSDFDDTEADKLVWKGKVYKAMKPADWSSYGYDAVIGVRIE